MPSLAGMSEDEMSKKMAREVLARASAREATSCQCGHAIEEHGGDADTDMSLKKLRRLAKESLES